MKVIAYINYYEGVFCLFKCEVPDSLMSRHSILTAHGLVDEKDLDNQ